MPTNKTSVRPSGGTTIDLTAARIDSRIEELLHVIEGETHSFEPASILCDLTGMPTQSAAPMQNPVERVLASLEPSAHEAHLGRLNHYEVTSVMGRGGFGVVLRAHDQKLHRDVAIKVLSPVLAHDETHRERFLTEARSAAAVKHANVVQIYAVEERPLPFLVMELVEGRTLHRHLADTGPLSAAAVLPLAVQIAAGLSAAHAQRIVHRDIKPANILVESGTRPVVKLTDFGLAHTVDDNHLVLQKVLLGTPAYMSPEQVRGEATDHRSDLFSLGSVLYFLCCGQPAFSESSTIDLLRSVTDKSPVPLLLRVPGLPRRLVRIIERLHQKDAALRYSSADELLADLERASRRVPLSRLKSPLAWLSVAAAATACWTLLPALSEAPTDAASGPSDPAAMITSSETPSPDSFASPGSADSFPAEQKVYDVLAEMARRNPAFDPRRADFGITDGRITFFRSAWASDFTPLAVLTDVERLELYTLEGISTPTDLSFVTNMRQLKVLKVDGLPLKDLEPLRGLPLEELSMWCWNWNGLVNDGDLSPLEGMPLQRINAGGALIRSLEPLRGLPLTELNLNSTSVSDISPLAELQQLKILTLGDSKVADIGPLAGLPLLELELSNTAVHDLSPLKGAPLRVLSIPGMNIDDLSVLTQVPLNSLRMDYDADIHRELLKQFTSLEQLNHRPIEELLNPEVAAEE
ncbi:MAG: protein kinase [Planctomycetaceae bacterium]|nr:protein kinase [Planctomycetaceae bacterium]